MIPAGGVRFFTAMALRFHHWIRLFLVAKLALEGDRRGAMKLGMRRRNGFTLVELLVVIAIIAVLAGFSLVLFKRGREAARAAKCVSNLKQICANQVILSQENGGFIVHPESSAPLGSWKRNWTQFHTIMLSDDFNYQEEDDRVNVRMRTIDYFQCPTAYEQKRSEMSQKKDHDGWRTYMLNERIGAVEEPSAEDRERIDGASTLIEVASPSKLVLASERMWDGSHYPTAGGPWPGEVGYGDFHNGGFHVGYMDGHVVKHTKDDFLLGGETLPSGQEGTWTNPEFALMWRGRLSSREFDN